MKNIALVMGLLVFVPSVVMGMENGNVGTPADVPCSKAIVWNGENNTKFYNKDRFSLYLGNKAAIGQSFVQISDTVVDSFPAIRKAVINKEPFLCVSSMSSENINLISYFLNIQTPGELCTLIKDIAEKDLGILNKFVIELGGNPMEKKLQFNQGQYGVGTYDAGQFSLIADTCKEGNNFIQIPQEVKASVPGLADSPEKGKSIKGIKGEDAVALNALAHYMTFLNNKSFDKLTNLIATTPARTLADILPVLKDLYKTNNPIGFDGYGARISWVRSMYNKYGQPLLSGSALLIIVLYAYNQITSK